MVDEIKGHFVFSVNVRLIEHATNVHMWRYPGQNVCRDVQTTRVVKQIPKDHRMCDAQRDVRQRQRIGKQQSLDFTTQQQRTYKCYGNVVKLLKTKIVINISKHGNTTSSQIKYHKSCHHWILAKTNGKIKSKLNLKILKSTNWIIEFPNDKI